MPQNSQKKKVLLVGWDGADWQHITPLLEQGLMPNLERLINRGVMGNLATLRPVLSPMLWNTIATGKLPDQHGIYGFVEPDNVNGGSRPATSLSRKTKAIWNILSQSGLRSNVVGWWASHPAEKVNGIVVSDNCKVIKRKPDGSYLVPPGTIHPAEYTELFAPCSVALDEIRESDIYPFIPEAHRIDLQNDKLFSSFVKILAECATVQGMTTAAMSKDEWDFTATYFTGIDHFCHSFMPYAPPKMARVDQEKFEIYKDVINSAYRFHDAMLGAQLTLAGEDALVVLCSDHGFLSGDQRPLFVPNEPAGPAEWHRDYGILVMAGPGVKKDERVYGASLIDITPTILAYLGLPLGKDMRGRPLTGAFNELPPIETVDTWDDIDGSHGMHPEGTELSATHGAELKKQFVALGYVEDHGDDNKNYEQAVTEQDYNLARVFLSTNRPDKAKELCERLVEKYPWEIRFIRTLAQSYYLGGYYQQCLNLLDLAYPADDAKSPPVFKLIQGRALLKLGKQKEAKDCLQRLLKSNPFLSDVHAMLGTVCLSLSEDDLAKDAYLRAIEIDPEKAIAHQGLAEYYLKHQQFAAAAESALDAVGVLHHLPKAHFILGQSLVPLGELDRAIQAMEISLHLNPENVKCHLKLAECYRLAGNLEQMSLHTRKAEEVEQLRGPKIEREEADRAQQTFLLPEIPTPEMRRQILRESRPQELVQPGSSGRTLVLISGLPRSGTSLMMQMLEAGGLQAKTDGERTADTDNPEGYLEWEAIKQIRRQPELLDDENLDRQAIKVISMLLADLPKKHKYKIVFMRRPVEEIVASQLKMINRLGTDGAALDAKELSQQLFNHRRNTIVWLGEQENVEFCLVNYHDLLNDPKPVVDELVEFLGKERLPQCEKMQSAIRKDLYRQKGKTS